MAIVLKEFLKRAQRSDLVSSAFLLVLLATTIQMTQVLSRLDYLLYDLGQKAFFSQPPSDIVIIAIDEASLAQLGRWPWSRSVHADLLKRLNSAKPLAIGLDIIFSEPDVQDAMADQALASAISASGKVVLPVLLESTRINGQMVETLPLPSLVAHAADLGRVHALLDEDSIARSVYLFEGLGAPTWQLFGQAVINVSKQQATQNKFSISQTKQPYTLVRTDQRGIRFLGSPGHFKTISYSQVLSGEYEAEVFDHKIVLVGATALGMNDLLSTPVSGLGQPMSGVEFHANVIESIRQNGLIKKIGIWVNLVVVILFGLLPLVWLPKVSPLAGLTTTLLYMLLVGISLVLLPMLTGFWIPSSAVLVTILVAYPIWSWRKLEAAQRFLDDELTFLRKNLIGFSDQTQSRLHESYDVFDARIAQVRMASEQLKTLQESRKETLAFISHDLRAPISSALSALERFPQAVASLQKPLLQALAMAEDFLQTSRAEMADDAKFSELDLAGLIHQAIDDAYMASVEKSVLLTRNIVEGSVWLDGSFGLLHRAALNLILNGIKFSPDQASVIVELTVEEPQQYATFSVSNHGPGISPDAQQQLFKRFSRVTEHADQVEGTGLGLYFVKTVIEKHHGNIHVESDLGEVTTFRFQLPIKGFQPFAD